MLCIYTTRHDVCKICILNHYTSILFLSAIVDKKEATGPKPQVLKDRLAFLFASSGIIANYHNINYVGVPAVLLSYNIFSNFILVSKQAGCVRSLASRYVLCGVLSIPKSCKAPGATSVIIYVTYQHEKYTCLECTFQFIALAILNHRKLTMTYEGPRSETIYLNNQDARPCMIF